MKARTWIPALAIAVVATAAASTGLWIYVPPAVAAVMFAAVAFARPRLAMLIWLLCAPLATVYGTVPLPGGIPDITFTRAMIVLTGIALLVRARVHGRPFLPIGPVELAMAALLFVLGADLLLRSSNLPSEALQQFDERVAPVLLFVLARSLYTRAGDARRILWILTLVGVTLAAHGTYQYARSGEGPRITDAPVSLAREEGGQRTVESHLERGRAVGPFDNAVEFGSVTAVAFCAALLLALHARGWVRAVPAVLIQPIAAAVVLSLTRSVWLGAYAAVLVLAWCDRERRAVLLTAIGAVTIAAAVAFAVLPASNSLRERAVSAEPVSGRLLMHEVGAELAFERPLVGHGSGAPSRRAARRKLLARGGEGADLAPGQFHDTFLTTAVEWGLPGLLANIAILVLFVRGALALRRRVAEGDDECRLADLFLFASVVYVLQCALVDVQPFLYLNGLYFFLAGVVYGQLDGRTSAADERAPLPVPATAPA